MELKEKIKVMQHYEIGGEIECAGINSNDWELNKFPLWNWMSYDYRIKEPKQKVTIEKWLCKSGENSFYIHEGTDADGLEKVKLMEIYEVEL